MPWLTNPVVASAARTTSSTTTSIPHGSDGHVLNLQVTVTAVSGTTPSMALSVLWSQDGTNFGPVDGGAQTFAAITTTGTVCKQVPVVGKFYQLSWTLTGTSPSFTFTVAAQSI